MLNNAYRMKLNYKNHYYFLHPQSHESFNTLYHPMPVYN